MKAPARDPWPALDGELPDASSAANLTRPRIECRSAFYDDQHASWTLSMYADVSSALRHPHVVMHGTTATQSEASVGQQAVQHKSRQFAREAALSTRISTWRSALEPLAFALAQRLHVGDTIDLMSALAQPWCRAFATLAVEISDDIADECTPHAQMLYAAMAHATSGAPNAASLHATQAIGVCLAQAANTNSPTSQHASRVQTFVAISQSLAGAMASVWHLLLQHPVLMERWMTTPPLRAAMVEELLRFSSPSRVLFRETLAPVRIGPVDMAAGQQISLRIAAANQDASVFDCPTQLRMDRDAAPHLALGLGMHHCAGAAIVRMALECVTTALLTVGHDHQLRLSDQISSVWLGGFAIDHPVTLPVVRRAILTRKR